MAISTSLHNELIAAASGGAMLIAPIILGRKVALKGASMNHIKTWCGSGPFTGGITGKGGVSEKEYSDRECVSLLWQGARVGRAARSAV